MPVYVYLHEQVFIYMHVCVRVCVRVRVRVHICCGRRAYMSWKKKKSTWFSRSKEQFCNKFQRTAIHCNTLQHIATRCNTQQNTLYTYIKFKELFWLYVCGPCVCVCVSLDDRCDWPQHGSNLHFQVIRMLQCVAVCCSALLCVAECCSVLWFVAVCCIVLRGVAVCCSVLQCRPCTTWVESVFWRCMCCSALQCVALCCCVLQCVAA